MDKVSILNTALSKKIRVRCSLAYYAFFAHVSVLSHWEQEWRQACVSLQQVLKDFHPKGELITSTVGWREFLWNEMKILEYLFYQRIGLTQKSGMYKSLVQT